MNKLLLFFSAILISSVTQAQIFRLTYNATVCPSPLNASTGVYLYAGANTTNPGAAPSYFADANQLNLYPLYQTSTGIWEICFNPYQIFKDFNGTLMPGNATIYSFTINFRNSSSTIFTGTCNHGSITIDNPLSNPFSSAPNIGYGLVVSTCNVGLNNLQNNISSITHSNNPLRTNTTFSININGRSKVSVEFYNILGKKVFTLLNNKELNGYNEFIWDGTDNAGNLLANGCYFYRFTVNDKIVSTNKIIISH